MVQQLLMFARGGDGQLARVHTGAVAHEVFRLMRDTLPKSIGVRLEVEDGLWDVYADVTQLHQVLTNLAVNARDAMEHGGHLTIGAKMVRIDHTYAAMNPNARPGHYVSLWVDDTGCGMPKAVIDRIFEPFFTTKEVGRGTGLGLSTVHAIVRGHGGFINVYSEQGRGSRFHVYIPALPPTADATSLPEVSAVLARYRGKGQLILVVDDEDPVRVTASRTLVRYGYRVLEAKNGAEAIAEYAQHWRDIDMVLTDMAMPILDGPSAIIAMRAINPRVRVVGSSGLRARASPRGAELEVEYFLQKPYSAESLLRTLAQVLDRDQARPGGADLAFQMDGP